MASKGKALIVIGSGPGNGRAVTTLFAKNRYNNVTLIARRSEQLKPDQKAVEEAAGVHVNVKTYAVDVFDSDTLLKTLEYIDAQLGKPECIFYNWNPANIAAKAWDWFAKSKEEPNFEVLI
jgi:NAD(P)-dependent dehydrogenase (short-subunit alcohol dehydrogenase family)